MRKRVIIGIVIAALVGTGVYLKVKASEAAKYTAVKTSVVQKGDVKSYLSTTAVIKSKNSKSYYGQQYKISKVNVKVGDAVKKGQVLVTYDVSELSNAVKQAQIQYDNQVLAKQILTNRNNDIKDNINEIDDKIASVDKQLTKLKKNSNQVAVAAEITKLETEKTQLQSTKDSSKTISSEEFKQADNAVELAKINLDSAKSKVTGENITADFDGVITAVNATEGSYGNASAAVIVLQDLNSLKAVVAVGKYDVDKIKVDQPAEIKLDEAVAKGKVAAIDPVATKSVSSTGAETTLNTEVDITENPGGLMIDFDADINILLGEKTDVLKVAAEAVRSDKTGKNYVFVVENNVVVQKTVTLGLQSDLEVEIIEGIAEGDKVILNPGSDIEEGTLVKES